MSGEGLKISYLVIGTFALMSITSIMAVAFGKVDVNSLKVVLEIIRGYGDVLGIGMLLAFWLGSRGQTSQ